MKTYILLKDLPNVNKGTELVCDGGVFYKGKDKYGTMATIAKLVVETHSDWFKLKQEKLYTEEDMRKCFYAPIHIEGNGRTDTFEEYLKTIQK